MSNHMSNQTRPAPRPGMGPQGMPGGPGGGPGRHMMQGKPEKPKSFGPNLRRLLAYFRPHWLTLVAVLVLTILATLFSVFAPILSGQAIDLISASTGGKPLDATALMTILGSLALLYGASSLATFGTQWIMSGISQTTVHTLRAQVQGKLGKIPLAWFDSRPHGDILSRMTNDVDTIGTTLQQSVTQAISSAVQLVGFLAIMLTLSWQLTLAVILTLPLYMLATGLIAKHSQKSFAVQQKELGLLAGQVEEILGGIQVVKAFGHEASAREEYRRVNERLKTATQKANFVSGLLHPAMNAISNAAYVTIAVLGGLLVRGALLSLGGMVAFIQYARNFTQPIMQVAQITNVIQSTVACAERIFEVLDTPEEHPRPLINGNSTTSDKHGPSPVPRTIQTEKHRGEVCISDLDFSYLPEAPLIKGLDLTARPGHTVAIVGPTGAGKTTLVNLLMAFYDPQRGSISLDGTPTTALDRHDIRSRFGMVLQDTWLFSGTIRDNIAYGRPGATDKDIEEAATAAHADHFIRTLPDGYDAMLSEDGGNLSQGQRQLLTIARALLADPDMLILDEATSNVDTRTETLIQRAMATLMEGRTSFVIAHRLSTIRDAELILVMEKGSIIEQGTHETLLAAKGAYHDLFMAQFAGLAT